MYSENHMIVAWLKRGYADKWRINKKKAKNSIEPKAPSGRELARERETEGERVTMGKQL